jgi:hypothetical protein
LAGRKERGQVLLLILLRIGSFAIAYVCHVQNARSALISAALETIGGGHRSTSNPVNEIVKENHMTFLQHLGGTLKKALRIGITVATDAEPIVALAFPEVIPLYQSTLGLATGVEALAPTTTGTGAQKLSQLLSSLLPQAQAWAQKNNINWPAEDIQKWASAVVDTVNLIPAPASATPAA